jgi:hypothetical protein
MTRAERNTELIVANMIEAAIAGELYCLQPSALAAAQTAADQTSLPKAAGRVVVGARTLSLLGTERPRLVRVTHATRILHSRRLSVSRMRKNFTYGWNDVRWRRAAGLLDRNTFPKGEKRSGVAGPHTVPRHCSTLPKRDVTDALPERVRGSVRSARTPGLRDSRS